MKILSPSTRNLAAYAEILSLQYAASSDICLLMCALSIEIAPPCVRRRSLCCSRRPRSRRTVISDTPSSSASSSFLISSLSRTRVRIFCCLSSTTFRLFFISFTILRESPAYDTQIFSNLSDPQSFLRGSADYSSDSGTQSSRSAAFRAASISLSDITFLRGIRTVPFFSMPSKVFTNVRAQNTTS